MNLEEIEMEDFATYQIMWATVVSEGIRIEQISDQQEAAKLSITCPACGSPGAWWAITS